MNINRTSPNKLPVPILRLAFRPFFLFAASFSLVALLIWIGQIGGQLTLNLYGGPLWWHAHEMLFGFVIAVVAGFLLTAVQNWTGLSGVKGKRLLFLLTLWLAGRIVMFFPDTLPQGVIALIDLMFLPAVATLLALPIIKIKQYRNLIFVPLLLLMTFANGRMHWGISNPEYDPIAGGSYGMIFLVTLLMSIIAGRVMPMFTANGTATPKVSPLAWLEVVSIVSMALLALMVFSGFSWPPWVMAGACFITACLHLARFVRWRFWLTARVPLLWSLHLSYFFIIAGLLLFSAHYALDLVSLTTALHMLTVGAMANMILSMISRVSLGHTGRPLKVGPLMSLAFISLALAAIVRVILPSLMSDYLLAIQISAVLWLIGFGLFVLIYFPILTRARGDGKPG